MNSLEATVTELPSAPKSSATSGVSSCDQETPRLSIVAAHLSLNFQRAPRAKVKAPLVPVSQPMMGSAIPAPASR